METPNNVLSGDVLECVLKHLSARDLASVGCVCRGWCEGVEVVVRERIENGGGGIDEDDKPHELNRLHAVATMCNELKTLTCNVEEYIDGASCLWRGLPNIHCSSLLKRAMKSLLVSKWRRDHEQEETLQNLLKCDDLFIKSGGDSYSEDSDSEDEEEMDDEDVMAVDPAPVPDPMTRVEKEEPLLWASATGHATLVHELIALGVNVNKVDDKDNKRKTALIYASENGDVDVVRELLAHGANVDQCMSDRDSDSWDACHYTALRFAIDNDHTGVVEVLLDNGADANFHSHGFSLLHYALTDAAAPSRSEGTCCARISRCGPETPS